MYLHIYQYPGLEWLPLIERHKIVNAAAEKYDPWWIVRSALQTLAFLFLPVASLITVLVLGELEMIDFPAAIEVLQPYLADDIERAYYIFGAGLIYFRCVNSSGLAQMVEAYLEDQKHQASLDPSADDLERQDPSQSILKRRKFGGKWLLLYPLVVGTTIFAFTSNYPPKTTVTVKPFLFVEAVKIGSEGYCDIKFSMQNLGAGSIDEMRLTFSYHSGSGDTISTGSNRFRFIDSGRSGAGEGGFLTQEECKSARKVRLREVSVCKIGGVNYNGCQKYIQSSPSAENLLNVN